MPDRDKFATVMTLLIERGFVCKVLRTNRCEGLVSFWNSPVCSRIERVLVCLISLVLSDTLLMNDTTS